jgi:hypothetical protein
MPEGRVLADTKDCYLHGFTTNGLCNRSVASSLRVGLQGLGEE